MHTGITYRLVTAVTGALAAAAVTPALASAGAWLQPTSVNLSTALDPAVALDASGNALVAWQEAPGSPASTNIQAAHRPVGGAGFAQLPDVSTDTTSLTVNTNPVIVMNRSGDGLVVWLHEEPAANDVELRTIAPDDTVGPILSTPVVGSVSNPTAAINANGDAVVVWQQGAAIAAITRHGLAGTFNTASPDMLEAGSAETPTAAIDGAGNAIAAWHVAPSAIAVKLHPAGGSWSASEQVVSAPAHAYSSPELAANPNGQAVLAFDDNDGINTVASVATGTVSAGFGATATGTTVSGPDVSHGPFVTVDDAGGAAVAWGTSTAVQVSLRPPGGSFPSPAGVQTIAPSPVTPDAVAMAGNGAGAVVVAYDTFDTGALQNVVRGAVKPAGTNTFEAAKTISDTSKYSGAPVAAFDENGDAMVAYPLGTGAPPQGVAEASYDGSGPQLGTPTGPSTVQEGTAAPFSVPQPVDAFSSVANVSWSFGDGSAAATGTSVSHTFTRAGTFTVTVTATDAVGNTSSASLQVTVTATTPPPTQCVVPKLKRKTLSKAKTLLKKAHCALGKVHKPKRRKHHKLGKLVVKGSSPGAGKRRPAGTKVSLTLTKAPKKHRHKH